MLGELLLDRNNFNVMIRFISSKHNLKTIMNLLRDRSPNIQFEAFHVFKVFVANPKKPKDVELILFKNKPKLIAFLESFQNEKEDSQFTDEKNLLIETLSRLELETRDQRQESSPILHSNSSDAIPIPSIPSIRSNSIDISSDESAVVGSQMLASPVSSYAYSPDNVDDVGQLDQEMQSVSITLTSK